MKKHPFEPFLVKNSKKAIIGTVPPENINFYYSNSKNSRMWDILRAILNNSKDLPENGFALPKNAKEEILEKLKLSMFDIVYKYERKNNSTKDKDIKPIEFLNVNKIIKNTQIENLIFVYKQAAKWFLKSMRENSKIINKLNEGEFYYYILNGKKIKCILLPAPLNRGSKNMTLLKKLEIYKKYLSN